MLPSGQNFDNPQIVLANPYDDDYPPPFIQAHSHIDPDHHGPCSETLSPSRKRERSPTPSSLNGALQSNEPLSKRRKRDRPHKKKAAREKARLWVTAGCVESCLDEVDDWAE